MMTGHVMAAADWLIDAQGVPVGKLFEMWSVLDLETELTKLMKLKQQSKKQTLEEMEVAPTTPKKTPKTRNQKKEHTKVSKSTKIFKLKKQYVKVLIKLVSRDLFDEKPGPSNITEHEQLQLIQNVSKTAALTDDVSKSYKRWISNVYCLAKFGNPSSFIGLE